MSISDRSVYNELGIPQPQPTTGVQTAIIYQPWFGQGNKHHENVLAKFRPGYVAYDCTDPAYVSGFCDRAQKFGCQGVIPNWYGDYQTFVDKATFMMYEECKKRGMWCALQYDHGIFKYKKHPTYSNLQETTYQLDFIKEKYLSHPAQHKTADGRNLMLEFCDTDLDGQWPAVLAHNQSIAWLGENINTKTKGMLAGYYCWTPTNPVSGSKYFYQGARDKSKIWMGMLNKGFDDANPTDTTKSIWSLGSPHRFFPENNGQTFLDVLAVAKQNIALVKYLLLVTGNDWEEGTAMEWGIDNGVSVQVSFTGGVIKLNVTGNVNGVDHYEVALTNDQNKTTVLNLDSATSLDLNNRPELSEGTYTIQATAVGKACFQNKVSNTAQDVLSWK